MTETELQTRRRRIDTALVEAGWQVTPLLPGTDLSRLHAQAVPEFETAHGPADYALFADGLLVGVVEAKRLAVGPQQALTQAERYSRGARGTPFDFDGFHIPFLYATNGEVIHFHDVREPHHRSRRVRKFHTPSALRELLARSTSAPHDWFEAHPNQHPWLRPYQKEANNAVEAALAAGRREMLVAMATGTGRTVTIVNQVYRLLKSGAAKRVLFLVDRRALAAQAVRTFASFEPEPNLKFDRLYEVYSNRFQKEDFGEDDLLQLYSAEHPNFATKNPVTPHNSIVREIR